MQANSVVINAEVPATARVVVPSIGFTSSGCGIGAVGWVCSPVAGSSQVAAFARNGFSTENVLKRIHMNPFRTKAMAMPLIENSTVESTTRNPRSTDTAKRAMQNANIIVPRILGDVIQDKNGSAVVYKLVTALIIESLNE